MKPYFSHDEGARNDPKLIKVLMRLGQAGKGVYWDLVEMLYEQGGYLLLEDCESHAFALRTDCELILKLVNDFDLFATDGARFWSETCLARMEMRDAKKLARAEAGAKGGKIKAEREAVAKALLEHDHSNASQNPSIATALLPEILAIKGKERKRNTTSVVVAAHTDPDDLQGVDESPLSKPGAFAVIMQATGYPNLDIERYRLQIAAKSEGVRRTSSQWRSRIIEFVNNDYTAGKLLTHPVLTPNEIPGNWNTASQGAYTAPMGQGIPHPSSYLKPDFIPSC